MAKQLEAASNPIGTNSFPQVKVLPPSRNLSRMRPDLSKQLQLDWKLCFKTLICTSESREGTKGKHEGGAPLCCKGEWLTCTWRHHLKGFELTRVWTGWQSIVAGLSHWSPLWLQQFSTFKSAFEFDKGLFCETSASAWSMGLTDLTTMTIYIGALHKACWFPVSILERDLQDEERHECFYACSPAGSVVLSVHVADNWPTKLKLLCEIVQLLIWPLHGHCRLEDLLQRCRLLIKPLLCLLEVLILSTWLSITLTFNGLRYCKGSDFVSNP